MKTFEPDMHSFKASDGLTLRFAFDDFTNPWENRPTLVLVHAAMSTAQRMMGWVPHLARHYRVVRPDLRGHGSSDIPTDDQIGIDRLRDDVVELIDHLGIDRVHLAGSSAGGIISMYTAITRPDRITSLGAFASTPGLKDMSGRANYGSWAGIIRSEGVAGFMRRTATNRFDLDETDPGLIDWFIDEAARNDPESLCRFVGVMGSVNYSERLGEIACPTLYVVPGDDPHHPLDEYKRFADAIPDCKFMVYPGMRHNITDVAPDRCAEDLKAFLDALP